MTVNQITLRPPRLVLPRSPLKSKSGVAAARYPLISPRPISGADIVRSGLQYWLDINDFNGGQNWISRLTGYGFFVGGTGAIEASDPVKVSGPPDYWLFNGSQYFDQDANYSGTITRTAGRSDQPFTIEAWINRGAVVNTDETLFANNAGAGAGTDGFRWMVDFTGNVQAVHADGSVQYSSSSQVPSGVWRRVALTGKHDGSVSNTFYLNDAPDGGGAYNGTANWSSGDSAGIPTIGTTNNTTDNFQNGTKLAIVRVYDRILSAEELSKNFNAEKARFGL